WNHDLAFANNSSYQEHWLADFPNDYLREAHEDRWNVVATAFRCGTGLEDPDDSLRYWEQNRRVPLALRLIGEDHPLWLPPGSYGRQYVLTSSVRRNIPRRGKGWLHHSHLVGSSATSYVQRHAKRKHFDADKVAGVKLSTGDEQQRFHKFLAENFPKL